MKSLKWLGLLAALHAGASFAQESPAAGPRHEPADRKPETKAPGDPHSGVLVYLPSFADYRRFAPDEPLKDWRAANDEVRNQGGPMSSGKASAPAVDSKHPHVDPAVSKGGKP